MDPFILYLDFVVTKGLNAKKLKITPRLELSSDNNRIHKHTNTL